jgi:hypothetical protein
MKGNQVMTPMQREELDLEIRHIDGIHEWRPYNRRVTDANKFVPWLCAIIAVPIVIIVGAEILWHFMAWIR